MTSAPKATAMPRLRFTPAIGWPTTAWRSAMPDDGGPLRLGIDGATAIAVNESFGSFGGRRLPQGMAIGPAGRIFLADPANDVILSALAADCARLGNAAFVPLWPRRDQATDAYALRRPTDVAFTPAGNLAIADATCVRVLDWPTMVLRHVLLVPGWQPVALACSNDGSLYVADQGHATIRRFDRQGRRDPAFPHPDTPFVKPEALAALDPNPCSCTAECHCHQTPQPAPRLYVLDQGRLIALDARGRIIPPATDSKGREVSLLPDRLSPPALRRTPNGLEYDDPALPGHDPLRLTGLKLTRDGRLAGPDLPLVAMPRHIEVPRSGGLIFDAFDSGQRGFAWDRIALEIDMPVNASLVVQTLATDRMIDPQSITEQPDAAWSRALTITARDLPEILVQSPAGRFLWLKLALIGDGSASPAISRIDIFGPRRSGLSRLPASFQQDPQSRDFLDRFLSYFDTIFAELRAANAGTTALFDPASVPEGDWLDWLGRWFDLDFLASWDVATRREMVAAAIDQAKQRGTAAGLARMLRWHLRLPAPWPTLIEHFRLGPPDLKVAQIPLPATPEPHRVTIVLPRATVAVADEPMLTRLLQLWLPAHVKADVIYVEPGLVISCQSMLGVDTLLGDGTAQPLGQSRLGKDFSTQPPRPGISLYSRQIIGASHVGQCA